MKLTGPACTEATSGAEEARRRERTEGSAGGVRVERRVRCRVTYDTHHNVIGHEVEFGRYQV